MAYIYVHGRGATKEGREIERKNRDFLWIHIYIYTESCKAETACGRLFGDPHTRRVWSESARATLSLSLSRGREKDPWRAGSYTRFKSSFFFLNSRRGREEVRYRPQPLL